MECIYCGGRLVVLDGERFIEFDARNGDATSETPYTDLEPIKPGDICCAGPIFGNTQQAAYDRACGYFD